MWFLTLGTICFIPDSDLILVKYPQENRSSSELKKLIVLETEGSALILVP